MHIGFCYFDAAVAHHGTDGADVCACIQHFDGKAVPEYIRVAIFDVGTPAAAYEHLAHALGVQNGVALPQPTGAVAVQPELGAVPIRRLMRICDTDS